MTANATDEQLLHIRQPQAPRPAVGVNHNRMRAIVAAARYTKFARARLLHLFQADLVFEWHAQISAKDYGRPEYGIRHSPGGPVRLVSRMRAIASSTFGKIRRSEGSNPTRVRANADRLRLCRYRERTLARQKRADEARSSLHISPTVPRRRNAASESEAATKSCGRMAKVVPTLAQQATASEASCSKAESLASASVALREI